MLDVVLAILSSKFWWSNIFNLIYTNPIELQAVRSLMTSKLIIMDLEAVTPLTLLSNNLFLQFKPHFNYCRQNRQLTYSNFIILFLILIV